MCPATGSTRSLTVIASGFKNSSFRNSPGCARRTCRLLRAIIHAPHRNDRHFDLLKEGNKQGLLASSTFIGVELGDALSRGAPQFILDRSGGAMASGRT